jgi:hypothetical protein
MTSGLWPKIRAISPPAVAAAIRVSERRARLLGLDEPIVRKNEVTAALSVTAQQYAAERELFLSLPVEQLGALAAESQALVDKAFAMARAHGAKLDAATAPAERGDGRDAPVSAYPGTDVVLSGDGDRPLDPTCAQPRTTPVLVAASPSPAAVDDGAAQGPAVESTGSDVDDV